MRLFLSLALSLSLFELGTLALVRGELVQIVMPTGGTSDYWDGRHQEFGVWRFPNGSWRHQTDCFDVEYESNSVGARDREWETAGSESRVVVLGDSFIEGWGLPVEERLTNLLEARSGVEHLNFGMSHFGTYQQLLVYEKLARLYAHDRVLVAVTPVNDFFDLDYELASRARYYEFRYRPYLLGDYPDYERFDFREPWYRWAARKHTYSYNAVAHLLSGLGGQEALWESPDLMLTHSFFYDFTDAQFDLMRYSLEKITEAAENKDVVVLLLPVFTDFARFYQVKQETTPLGERLREVGESKGFQVVDLMPSMFREEPHWKGFFFGCDYHYNELGNRMAFEAAFARLDQSFYSP